MPENIETKNNREEFISQYKSLSKHMDRLVLVKQRKISMKARLLNMYKSFFNA